METIIQNDSFHPLVLQTNYALLYQYDTFSKVIHSGIHIWLVSNHQTPALALSLF